VSLPRPPRAVVFDFDGVIVESVAVKSRAFVELFPDRPDLHEAILEHHQDHLGLSRYEKLRWILAELLGEPVDEGRVEELATAFSRLVLEATVRCPLVPGAAETLEALAAAGVPAYVASGTPEDELRTIVERRGLADRFRGVWGSPRSKPEILRRLLAGEALVPQAVVMVGDGLSDHRAAREAGVPFVWRETPQQRARFDGIEVVTVPDLRDLPHLLAIPRASARGAARA
jgi:HAD superfamily hydrolase (TIGR01549 family)